MKKLLLIIVVLLSCFISTKVYALEDSFYEGEYIPDTYIKKFKDDKGKYEQMRVFRRNSDNRAVYCLELWETMNTNKNIIGYTSNQYNKLGINDMQWLRIALLAYYGYGYQNHTDIKWYAVTQYMIWQTLENNSTIYFTDTLNGNRVSKYANEINEMEALFAQHVIKPNVSYSKEILYNHTYRFMDKNNAIDKYELIETPGINVKRNGIVLEVTNSNLGNSSITFTRKDYLYSNEPTVYIDNSGQNLLLPGSFDTINYKMNFTIPTTDYTINKKSNDQNIGQASLENTTFEIYDNNHNYMISKTLDENNQIILKNMGYGSYYLKEVKSGEGYLLDNNEIEIVIDKDHKSIDITNQVIKNKIIINKYLKNLDGTMEKEEATFTILNNKLEELITFTTEEGKYELELPYGTYIIKQISGKDNYKFASDFNINVKEDGDIQEFNLYDEEKEKIIPQNEIGDITEPIVETEEIIYDIPNTYSKSDFSILNLLLVISIIIINKGKTNEEN